ncbi:CLUMA_CG014145, isoform A [Clunio marinus]|uniref:CLUMA_CG014145, isoform A n=1 Tax=Clunio marinus TaxID=568069 RepID=A0A1J1IP93_9DIPT|nr:CLUMA_CG014145, isoform A [Clunio marinus]
MKQISVFRCATNVDERVPQIRALTINSDLYKNYSSTLRQHQELIWKRKKLGKAIYFQIDLTFSFTSW